MERLRRSRERQKRNSKGTERLRKIQKDHRSREFQKLLPLPCALYVDDGGYLASQRL